MRNIIRQSNKGMYAKYSILGVIISSTLLAGCNELPKPSQEKVSHYEKNFEIIGAEKERMIGLVNGAIYRSVDRANKTAKPQTISVVPIEGVEISLGTGRYMITGYPAGNIFIYDENGELILTEIVGSYAGSGSLTLDIDSSYTVRADGGYDSVQITPVKTVLATDLTTGLWKVGTDIAPGEYDIEIEEAYGYLQIFEEGKEPILFELIGGKVGQTNGQVTLKAGQTIRVTDTSFIKFTKSAL